MISLRTWIWLKGYYKIIIRLTSKTLINTPITVSTHQKMLYFDF